MKVILCLVFACLAVVVYGQATGTSSSGKNFLFRFCYVTLLFNCSVSAINDVLQSSCFEY